MKRTSIKEKQAKSTKSNLQNQVFKTEPNQTFQSNKSKPQNSIHKPNWQIQNMLVNKSK